MNTWKFNSEGAIVCEGCTDVAFILADNDKWYCRECIRKRDALGEWADLVDLVEETSNEHPGAVP